MNLSTLIFLAVLAAIGCTACRSMTRSLEVEIHIQNSFNNWRR